MSVIKLAIKRIICVLLIIILLAVIISPLNVSNAVQTREIVDISAFPASYQPYLYALKTAHPNWTFTLYDTGLDWNTVIYNEAVVSHARNQIENKTGEWICDTCDPNVRWKHVSVKTTEYYMDPRNFLNEEYIFQFEGLTYLPSVQNIEGVKQILKGTFMDKDVITYLDSARQPQTINKSYATIIMEAAEITNISPYHIASRIKQEVTKANAGYSTIVSGEVEGYLGFYNYYNIQATGDDIIGNGLAYAERTDESTLRPWTDPEKAIVGGAKFLASKYIGVGQDTIYLQKFDVVEAGGLYNHQYMQSITAPSAEGKKVRSAYESLELLDTNFNFIIPVYRNTMPPNACPIPLDVSMPQYGEWATVKTNSSVFVRVAPGTSSAKLGSVYNGNRIKVLEKGLVKIDNYYWDKIVMPDGVTIGYMVTNYIVLDSTVVPPAPSGDDAKIQEGNLILNPEITTIEQLKQIYPEANIIGSVIGTGTKVEINGATYTIIKLGDVNGDGKSNLADALLIERNYVGLHTLENEFLKAGSVTNRNSIITLTDALKLKRYYVGLEMLKP